MANEGFYAQKQNESKVKIIRAKIDKIRSSLEMAERRLKSIDDHQDCDLYQSIRYVMGSRRTRAEEQILENYEKLPEIELKLLHKEREVCNDIFNIRETLEEEISVGYKTLTRLLEQISDQ